MIWIDSHAHPHLISDCHAHPHLINNHQEQNYEQFCHKVKRVLCVATRLDQYSVLRELTKCQNVDISLGQHPLELERFDAEFARATVAQDKRIVAIGETGFDSGGDLQTQREMFDQHADIAMSLGLPIILHVRSQTGIDVESEVIAALKNWPGLRGVLHCFTGSQKLADFACDINWKISFSGIVTFKNAFSLKEIARRVNLENILIETDSPYLAPEPLRGQVNVPANVRYVGEFLARLREMSQIEFAEIIEKNYHDLFKIRQV